MRILYLTQWFEPEPAFKGAKFAECLAASGQDVEVVTGFPNYPGGRLYPDFRLRPYRRNRTMQGLLVDRLFLFPSHDKSSLARALNYLSFFLSSLIFGLVCGGRYDAVYVYHPPITPGLAMAIVRKVRRLRLVVEIQDLWPDSVAVSGMASGSVIGVLDRVCRFVYSQADHIVVQADGMKDKLVERGVAPSRLTRVYNWATYSPPCGDEASVVPDEFLNHMNVVYGGNLGQAQSLAHLVQAMDIARLSMPSLRLHMFGNGIERELLRRRAEQLPGADTIIHKPVDRTRMDRIFDAADALVLHLKDNPLYDFTIPSKAQHYLACGKPIVAGLSGEAASILRDSNAAVVCPPEDVSAIAAALVQIGSEDPDERAAIGARGRAHYERHFSMGQAIVRKVGILERETLAPDTTTARSAGS